MLGFVETKPRLVIREVIDFNTFSTNVTYLELINKVVT